MSRKVTVYTSRTEQDNQQQIAESIVNFTQAYVRESIPFAKTHIWNFDQTGFAYEPSNLRTLSFRGERDTCLLIDSRNKHTHSYTVQPMIARNGHLFPKVLIVTQELNDDFGPILAPKMRELERRYGNVEIYASKSGKLTSSRMERWYTGTLNDAIEAIQNRSMIESQDEPAVLILADSLSGHSKASQQRDLLKMGAKMMRIPPQTTDRLQPLDVNFNRQLKIFYNRIMEESFYQDRLAASTSREGVINVHSLLHNQLSSPKYRDMIKYAWKNTDLNFNNAEFEHFPSRMVNQINFDFDQAAKCETRGFSEHAFVKCAHCGKLLCFHHFLERECFHPFGQSRSKREEVCEPDEDCDVENDGNETPKPAATVATAFGSLMNAPPTLFPSP